MEKICMEDFCGSPAHMERHNSVPVSQLRAWIHALGWVFHPGTKDSMMWQQS